MPATDYEVNARIRSRWLSLRGRILSFVNDSRVVGSQKYPRVVSARSIRLECRRETMASTLSRRCRGSVFAGGFFRRSTINPCRIWSSCLEVTVRPTPTDPSPNHFRIALTVDGDSLSLAGPFRAVIHSSRLADNREKHRQVVTWWCRRRRSVLGPGCRQMEALALDPHGALYVGRRQYRPAKVRGWAAVRSTAVGCLTCTTGRQPCFGLALDRNGCSMWAEVSWRRESITRLAWPGFPHKVPVWPILHGTPCL